jgi:ferredoxin
MASPIPAPSTVSVARVDLERCTICGHCMDVCTEAAISMNDVINIDPERCIGCAACVAECPVEAISMTAMDR